MTVGEVLLKDALPTRLHHYVGKPLDKKSINSLINDLSSNPDEYQSSLSKLTRLGFETATRMGSSVGIHDLMAPKGRDRKFENLNKKIKTLDGMKMSKKDKDARRDKVFTDFQNDLNKFTIDSGIKNNQTLAKVIVSGSRGSPDQYRRTVSAVGVVGGPDGSPMYDFPIKNSFADGLSPAEYLLHGFDEREGAVKGKIAISDSGYFSKQLSRATLSETIVEMDCGTDKGIPYSTDDKEAIGSFLARPIGGYNKNNEITALVLSNLRNKKIGEIIVRSPITCESSKHHHSNALCQLCVGKRDKGLPAIGDFVGLTAASSLGEPSSQITLGSKHGKRTGVTGSFEMINQLANPPKIFGNAAAVSETFGKITDVRKSPAGGYDITIDNKEKHYVPTGLDVRIKKGDSVEPGDILSEGLVNPATITNTLGIGQGRKMWADSMHQAYLDNGVSLNKKNFEIIAKAATDHVRVDDPDGIGDYLPDQIVSYQNIEKGYAPRPDSKLVRLDMAIGKYLEKPELHFTIGTIVTKKVVALLKRHGIQSVTVNDKKPLFSPAHQRLMDLPSFENDWAHQLYSDYIERKLNNAVISGMSSDIKGPSPILGIAFSKGFGNNGK